MDNQYKPNPKYKLISAVLNLVCAVVLVGIAIFFGVRGDPSRNDDINFWLFLAVGALFIFLSGRSLYKLWKQKQKKEEEAEKNNSAGGNKNDGSGKGKWDMNNVRR